MFTAKPPGDGNQFLNDIFRFLLLTQGSIPARTQEVLNLIQKEISGPGIAEKRFAPAGALHKKTSF
jgi:hypothetical protein